MRRERQIPQKDLHHLKEKKSLKTNQMRMITTMILRTMLEETINLTKLGRLWRERIKKLSNKFKIRHPVSWVSKIH